MNLFQSVVLLRIHYLSVRLYTCPRVNTIHKRAEILSKWIKNKDKRKNWHFEILQNHAKSQNVFENVSRPTRRQTVLNNLFISNISDVISTGDFPEIFNMGIEITGVKIAPCCKTVNIYWQSSKDSDDDTVDLGMTLNKNAPKIRSELIGRNIMGYVPILHFVRDLTNSYIVAFEKALQEADCGPENEAMIVPEDTFTSKKKKIYKFDSAKSAKEVIAEEKATLATTTKSATNVAPPRPADMKSDICGLKHDILMNKVIASKMKPAAPPSKNVIIAPEWGEKSDIFSDIPGTTVHEVSDREAILKQFHIQRKKMKLQKGARAKEDDSAEWEFSNEMEDLDPVPEKEDFIEEDNVERFH